MPLAADEYILDVTTELHKNQQVRDAETGDFYLFFIFSYYIFLLTLRSERMYFSGVLLDILPVRVVFPLAAGQSALRPSALQPDRARLLRRPIVGFALRTIATRVFGESY